MLSGKDGELDESCTSDDEMLDVQVTDVDRLDPFQGVNKLAFHSHSLLRPTAPPPWQHAADLVAARRPLAEFCLRSGNRRGNVSRLM